MHATAAPRVQALAFLRAELAHLEARNLAPGQ